MVPDYELLRRIGRGSYGEVWLARNVMGRFRAVKIIRREAFDHARPFEREFEGIRQYEPISRQHPGLTSILHIGRGEGYFYYVMEVADNLEGEGQINPDQYAPRTLAAELKRNQRLTVRTCAQVGQVLADGLAYLNHQGLVHRDIKPNNIIFVKGSPKLADVGLVAEAGEKGSFVGTAGYVPPEGPGTVAADIFSLGKVLYEMSMGKDREEFPELPTSWRELPEAPALIRLNAIITKACHPDPRRRFAAAEELGGALGRLLEELEEDSSTVSDTESGSRTQRSCVVLNMGDNAAAEELAQRLAGQLAEDGIRVLVDNQRQMTTGWARELEGEIAQARMVVVMMSEAALRSELTAYGLGLVEQALRQRKERPEIVFIRLGWKGTLPRLAGLLAEGKMILEWNQSEDIEDLIRRLRGKDRVEERR